LSDLDDLRRAAATLLDQDAETWPSHGNVSLAVAAALALALNRARKATKLLIALHVQGVLSEGQTAAGTGLDRIEVRRMADEHRETSALERA
jgi:acyl CoA:acetate/3-ketoacid CoA transferase alpha subunit